MPKLMVDGKEVEYSQDELMEAIEVLREDRVLKDFGDMKAQQKEILARLNKEEKPKEEESKGEGDPNGGAGGAGGSGDPKPGDGDPDVDASGKGAPAPPPKLTDEEKQENKPPKRKSRWWGDAINYED